MKMIKGYFLIISILLVFTLSNCKFLDLLNGSNTNTNITLNTTNTNSGNSQTNQNSTNITQTNASDKTGPIITITGIQASVSNVTIQGTAKDGNGSGVREVWVKHNANAYIKAIGTTNWLVVLELTNGTNVICVYAVDNATNKGNTVYRNIFKDIIPPDLTVISPLVSPCTDSARLFLVQGMASDENGSGVASVYLRNNGGSYKKVQLNGSGSGSRTWISNLNLSLGSNFIDIYAVDKAGNNGSIIQKVIISVPSRPTVSFTYPNNGFITSSRTIQAQGNVNDFTKTGCIIMTKINNSSYVPLSYSALSNWYLDLTLDFGTNKIYAYTVDNVDNVSLTNTIIIIYKDTVPPIINGGTSFITEQRTNTVTISGSASDGTGWGIKNVFVYVNGALKSTSTNWSFVQTLVNGSNIIIIKAIDKADLTNTKTNIIYRKSWQICGGGPVSAGDIYYPGMAAYNGYVYAGFSDGGISGRGVVKKFNGTSWQTVGTTGFTPGSIADSSLAIGSDGIPYFAFRDNANGNKISVMAYNGSSWNYIGSPGLSDNPSYYPTIAVNGTSPIIAYEDTGHQLAMVRYFDSGSGTWKHFGPDMYGKSMGDARFISLKLYNNTMYYAWVDVYYSSKLNCAYFNGSFCASFGDTLSASPANIDCTALSISASGVLHVGYVTSSGQIRVEYYNGTSWILLPTCSYFDVTGSSWFDIYVDGETPYVTFRDGGNGSKATVMKYINGNWEAVGIPGFSSGVSQYNKIEVVNGVPYVLYRDVNSQKATVMMYK